MASRTADRLTPNCFANWFSEGSFEPGANSRAVAFKYSAIVSGSRRARLAEELWSDIIATIAERKETRKPIKYAHLLKMASAR